MAELDLGRVVGMGIPAGGTDGDVLVKNGATGYAGRWTNTPPQMASLAYINTGNTADRQYQPGEYLVHNGQLYKVGGTAIGPGETLTPGGNIALAVIGDDVARLNRKVLSTTNPDAIDVKGSPSNADVTNASVKYDPITGEYSFSGYISVSSLGTGLSNFYTNFIQSAYQPGADHAITCFCSATPCNAYISSAGNLIVIAAQATGAANIFLGGSFYKYK